MNKTKRKVLVLAAVAIGLSSWPLSGCGSSDESSKGDGGSAGSGNNGQGGGGGLIISDDSGVQAGNAGTAGTTPIDPDAACATDTIGSSLQQLAIYVLMDRSKSMEDDDKRVNATAAFSQFVSDSSSAGIKIALNFFPNEGASCDGSGYDTPLVAMGALPGNAIAVNNALNGAQTIQGTPIEGALRGIQTFCSGYGQQNPAEKVVGVLITDGEPSQCETDSNALAAIAAGAYGGTPSVPIFTIGMDGAVFELLDQIAASGGTSKSYDVSQGGAASFLAALQAIAGQALPCEFSLPTGQSVDPAKVNVKYSDAGGDQYLGQVNDASACVLNGWYYDNATSPTKIILCQETCSAVRQQAGGQVSIVLGCQTQPVPPPK